MGWLRNILANLTNGFAWLSNWAVTFWNLIAQMLSRFYVRALMIGVFICGIVYGVIHVWSNVIQPVREWFIDGATAGFQSGDWGFSSLISDWVGCVNYVFPLDEALQFGAHLFLIMCGISAVLSVVRLIKTLIGGWI